jgi:hypothetical protein
MTGRIKWREVQPIVAHGFRGMTEATLDGRSVQIAEVGKQAKATLRAHLKRLPAREDDREPGE